MCDQNPLISVIVPVFNGEKYLENCIESIWGQTYSPLELLIVNDGSTDGTAKVCEKLMRDYEKAEFEGSRSIRVITLGDEGVSVARNTALWQAKGDYVCFVDADDRILPDMIAHLYENLVKYAVQISGCRFFVWTNETEWKDQLQKYSSASDEREDIVRTFSATDFRDEIVNRNCRCWSKLYDMKLIREENLQFIKGLSIGEDMLFLASLTSFDVKFCESDYEGYAYYQNAQGVMTRKFTKNTMDQITCWEKARELMGGNAKLDSIILISILLVMERIAVLEKEEIERYQEEVMYGNEKMKTYLSMEAWRELESGHKVKTLLFRSAPKLYVSLYHLWKRS